jgi:hypothetical protein
MAMKGEDCPTIADGEQFKVMCSKVLMLYLKIQK